MDRKEIKDYLRRVVITGLGVVSPNGIGKDNFWQAIKKGKSGIDKIHSFDASDYAVQIAAEIKDFAVDSYLFGKDKQRNLSRTVPLSLAATKEALEVAGLANRSCLQDDGEDMGVVIGSGGGAIEFTERQYELYHSGKAKKVSAYNISNSTIGTLASEISIGFGFRGMSHMISTGCTSSTDAIGYAFNNIRWGLIDFVVSGGVDAPIAPGVLRGFEVMRVLTSSWNKEPQRASRPFNLDRDGFVLGEGAWIVTLEELERALQRGAKIYAEVVGYGTTCDAYHRVRPDPDGDGSTRAMEMALNDAGLSRDGVDYINLHGTSTPINDKIETRAIKGCFGKRAYRIPASSLKSMIGHPQGACGAAGIVASILAMEEGFLPPTVNYEVPDPECDLDYIPNQGRKARCDVVLCNCIGFGSKNSVLVLKRYV